VDDALKGRACSSSAYDDVLNRISFEGDDTVRDACCEWPYVFPLSTRPGIHMHNLCVPSVMTQHVVSIFPAVSADDARN
jgi:hypothetical protein